MVCSIGDNMDKKIKETIKGFINYYGIKIVTINGKKEIMLTKCYMNDLSVIDDLNRFKDYIIEVIESEQ